MLVPNLVKNDSNLLLGIRNQSWYVLGVHALETDPPLNQELEPFLTILRTRQCGILDTIRNEIV